MVHEVVHCSVEKGNLLPLLKMEADVVVTLHGYSIPASSNEQ